MSSERIEMLKGLYWKAVYMEMYEQVTSKPSDAVLEACRTTMRVTEQEVRKCEKQLKSSSK